MDFDFSLILIIVLAIFGVIYLLDVFIFKPQRVAAAERYKQSATDVDQQVVESTLREPGWIEFPKSFFPVLLVVLILRSFLFEPFKIPSGSMIPTLEVGDFILVNKYAYGLRLPVIGTEIVPVGQPERGDIMVFRFPDKPTTNYIKRVVGLPGDKIRIENNRVYVNGEEIKREFVAQMPAERPIITVYDETLGDHVHKIYQDSRLKVADEQTWNVPEGNYFVMGDNRDHSSDSRVWGFVPENKIVGKAFAVWMQMPGWVPSFSENRFLYD